MRCPDCGDINVQIIGRDRKYSGCLGCLGFIIWGWVGLLLGIIGKDGKYNCICMRCGSRFNSK